MCKPNSELRTLIEENSFQEAVKKLGGYKKIDKALTAFVGPLARRPEGFPLVPGTNERLAKTKAVFDGDEKIPALRLWFTIIDENTILLRWIEEIPTPPDPK